MVAPLYHLGRTELSIAAGCAVIVDAVARASALPAHKRADEYRLRVLGLLPVEARDLDWREREAWIPAGSRDDDWARLGAYLGAIDGWAGATVRARVAPTTSTMLAYTTAYTAAYRTAFWQVSRG